MSKRVNDIRFHSNCTADTPLMLYHVLDTSVCVCFFLARFDLQVHYDRYTI